MRAAWMMALAAAALAGAAAATPPGAPKGDSEGKTSIGRIHVSSRYARPVMLCHRGSPGPWQCPGRRRRPQRGGKGEGLVFNRTFHPIERTKPNAGAGLHDSWGAGK